MVTIIIIFIYLDQWVGGQTLIVSLDEFNKLIYLYLFREFNRAMSKKVKIHQILYSPIFQFLFMSGIAVRHHHHIATNKSRHHLHFYRVDLLKERNETRKQMRSCYGKYSYMANIHLLYVCVCARRPSAYSRGQYYCALRQGKKKDPDTAAASNETHHCRAYCLCE